MTIAVLCPHCSTRYQLNPELAGKAMRCPNRDCEEVFTVVAETQPEPEPSPLPEPVVKSYTVEPPPVPVVESLPYALETEPAPVVESEPPTIPAAKLLPAKPAKAVPVAPALPVGPKVVEWSETEDPLSGPKASPVLAAEPISPKEKQELDALEAAIEARKRSQRLITPKRVLYSLLGLTVFTLAAIAIYVFKFNTAIEGKLAEEAKAEYEKGNFINSQTKYEELLTRFPESAERTKYQFFAAFSRVRGTISAVTFADNPESGIKQFKEFLKEQEKADLLKANTSDVYATGRQATDGLITNANLHLKAFRDEGRQKTEPLDLSEKTVAEAREMVTLAESYREKDAPLADTQRTAIGKLTGEIGEERHRLAVLAPFRSLPEDPTDDRIVDFETVLKAEKLTEDAEAKGIVDAAKRKLRELVRPERDIVASVPAPVDAALSLAVSQLVEAPPAVPGSERKPEGPPETVFALARGLLFALDAHSGQVLWIQRVSNGSTDPRKIDIPARVALTQSTGDVALVVSDVGGAAGLTARDLRSGEALWHQPLEAPAAGQAVVVKGRAYLPLRDSLGTVVELDVTDGTRLGHVRLRQPIGPAVALRPGTGLLYVPADARRVFVIDVDARSLDGDRQPARCVQVIPTEHLPNSLRGAPVVVGPPGLGPVPRYLVVMQSEGPDAMRLRAFPLTDPPKVVDPTAPVADTPAVPPTAEIPIAGWASFAPTSDGEKLALVSDRGITAVFGVNQPQNGDTAVFGLPVTNPDAVKADQPVAGQVLLSDEDTLWVVAGGSLQRLRVAVDAAQGLRLLPESTKKNVGEPIQRPQLNSRRDTLVTTVRLAHGGIRTIALDPRDGRILWQRQLAGLPVTPPLVLPQGILLVDEDGGVALVPPTFGQSETKNRVVPMSVGVAPPVPASAGPALACAAGNTAWVLVPEYNAKGVVQLRIRQIVDGKLAAQTSVPLPATPAGAPVAWANAVLVPLADGVVYRFTAGGTKLQTGPTWKSETAPAECTAHLATYKTESFFGSDGADKFTRWTWPMAEDAKWVKDAGPWECIGPITRPLLVLDTQKATGVYATDAGGISVYNPDKPGEPVRKWRGAKEGPIPAGEITQGPIQVSERLVYTVLGKVLVMVDPAADGAVGVLSAEGEWDSIGITNLGSIAASTDAAGTVRTQKTKDGTKGETVAPGLTGILPVQNGAAVPCGPNRLLLPLLDGSCVFVFVP